MVLGALQTLAQTGVDAIRNKTLTTIPVEDPNLVPFTEEEWGKLGELAYPAGAFEISRRNPSGSKLTDVQKDYLRPYFGSLVDRVTIHYGSVLLTELGYGQKFPKLSFGDTEGQTFGRNIYISESYANSFGQLNLIAHELVHSQQYEQRGSSLISFGRDYFEGYYSSGLVYEEIPMEQQAYLLQERFIDREAVNIVNIASRYSLDGSSSDRLYIDPNNPSKGYNDENLNNAEFDPGEIFFNLDSSTTATFIPSPLESQSSIPYSFSAADQESITEAFKLF